MGRSGKSRFGVSARYSLLQSRRKESYREPKDCTLSPARGGTKYYDSLPADVFLELEKICTGVIPYKKIKFPAVAWTKTDAPAPITNKHTYSILGLAGTKTPGGAWLTKYIVLRDPKNVAADPGFGANEVLASKWLMFDFTQKDGIFALKADLFPTYFQGYAYVPV